MALASSIKLAATSLKNSELIIYPTESCYGLGCDPFSQTAVEKLNQLKSRKNKLGFICVIGDLKQLKLLAPPLNEEDIAKLKATWPGHVSWVLPALDNLPPWLIGPNQTICIRYSSHPIIQQLCLQFGGPIISTSANLSGQKPALTIPQANSCFKDKISYYLNAPLGNEPYSSTIIALNSGKTLR